MGAIGEGSKVLVLGFLQPRERPAACSGISGMVRAEVIWKKQGLDVPLDGVWHETAPHPYPAAKMISSGGGL